MRKFKRMFCKVPDPRADNSWHDLLEVLFIALAAVLCGAEGPTDMEELRLAKDALLRRIMRLEHGITTLDTFSPVVRLLHPQAFVKPFPRFTSHIAQNLGICHTRY